MTGRTIKLTTLALAVMLSLVLLVHMMLLAQSDPIVRQASVGLPDWPAGVPPVRIALLSDIHVAGPDMPPSRLARVVEQVNDLAPDIVMIAGDVISDKTLATRNYPTEEAVAPLRLLNAPLGVVAVLGNHDHMRDAADMRRALQSFGIVVLRNDAVTRGPLAIGGFDASPHHAHVSAFASALSRQDGVKVVLSHSPDLFPQLPDTFGLTLAGHTHCGQIALPGYGPLATASHPGRRYACGVIREGKKTLIVTAGLGTSILPLRLGVPPDLWIVTVGPVGPSGNS